MTSPELEARRPPTGPGFADAVTFAFGDLEQSLFGLARIGLTAREDGSGAAGTLAVLFDGAQLAASDTAAVDDPGGDWDALAAGAVRASTQAPLERWEVAFAGEGGAGFELRFAALSPPASGALGTRVGREGYAQLCRVEGSVRTVGGERAVDCLGQRGHGWGVPAWERLAFPVVLPYAKRVIRRHFGITDASARTAVTDVDAQFDAVRPPDAAGHESESVEAVVVEGSGPEAVVRTAAEARLSTAYDASGRMRRAGMELWVDEEDEYPRRVAGEALCGTSLERGPVRTDLAFFVWHSEGRTGAGSYELAERA